MYVCLHMLPTSLYNHLVNDNFIFTIRILYGREYVGNIVQCLLVMTASFVYQGGHSVHSCLVIFINLHLWPVYISDQ